MKLIVKAGHLTLHYAVQCALVVLLANCSAESAPSDNLDPGTGADPTGAADRGTGTPEGGTSTPEGGKSTPDGRSNDDEVPDASVLDAAKPDGGVKGDSILALAAATLAPNQSVKLSTVLPGSTLTAGDGADFIQWGSSGVYDPTRHEVRWAGKRHSIYQYRFLVYDEASNNWSSARPVWSNETTNGHGYDHNTVDPATGDHYFRPYNTSVVEKWNGQWTALPAMGPATIAGSLSWFPGIGLIYVDDTVIRSYSGGSWSTISTLAGPAGYHNVSEYNATSQTLIFGCGNAGLAMRKMTAAKTIAPIADAPFNVGSSSTQGVLASAPSSDDFIAWKKLSTTWSRYNVGTNKWTPLLPSTGNGSTPQAGPPNLSSGSTQSATIGITIEPYGVMMFIQYQGTSANADVWLYRYM